MPTRTKTLKSRTTTELEHDLGLGALELGIAPGLPGDETGELVERAGIGVGQPRRGALAADPPISRELVDPAVERAAGRRRVRQALKMASGRRISDEVIDELLAGASTEEEIAGPGGLLAELTKRLVERAMEVELTDHVGYEPHCEPPGGAANQRNGTSPKTLITEHGKVQVDAPRDRDGSFEPKIVKKRQRRFVGFDDKILALYSRGLSVRDIRAHLREIYGPLETSTNDRPAPRRAGRQAAVSVARRLRRQEVDVGAQPRTGRRPRPTQRVLRAARVGRGRPTAPRPTPSPSAPLPIQPWLWSRDRSRSPSGRRRGSQPAVPRSRIRTAYVRFCGSRGQVTAPGYLTAYREVPLNSAAEPLWMSGSAPGRTSWPRTRRLAPAAGRRRRRPRHCRELEAFLPGQR